jgi:nucleoside-diphosphate-sugar epimerase
MKILILSSQSVLGRAVTHELASDHELRLLETEPIEGPPGSQVMIGDLLQAGTLPAAVAGVEAVIHTAELPLTPPADDAAKLDWYTRGTYDLMMAAVEAGVKRFIYCGTLHLFDTYPEDTYITEYHEPFPPPCGERMWRYLGEITVREFVRDHAITGTSLRLGTLVAEDEASSDALDHSWLDPRDAARAVGAALARDSSDIHNWVRRWQIHHVCAKPPNPRFLIQPEIQQGFEHTFAAAWAARGVGE